MFTVQNVLGQAVPHLDAGGAPSDLSLLAARAALPSACSSKPHQRAQLGLLITHESRPSRCAQCCSGGAAQSASLLGRCPPCAATPCCTRVRPSAAGASSM